MAKNRMVTHESLLRELQAHLSSMDVTELIKASEAIIGGKFSYYGLGEYIFSYDGTFWVELETFADCPQTELKIGTIRIT